VTSAAVVVLNWNKAEQTRHCIETARRATVAAVNWIVVDNGSAAPIEDPGSGVTLIRNPENLGFAGGVNCGLRHAFAAGASHVWLLNNDAEPLPGALDALLAAARADADIGLASAVILDVNADDAVDFHGGLWTGGVYHTTSDPTEYARWSATAPDRIWLLGTALLVSRRLIERIGYFDEALFAYWEDNDISRRSCVAGFRNVVVPDARVRHGSCHPGQSPGMRPPYYYYYMTRNELILLRRTGVLVRPRLLYWMVRRTIRLYGRLRSFPAQRRAVRRGLVDGVLGRGGAYRG
jgi:GT2 family glycosyltransferase